MPFNTKKREQAKQTAVAAANIAGAAAAGARKQPAPQHKAPQQPVPQAATATARRVQPRVTAAVAGTGAATGAAAVAVMRAPAAALPTPAERMRGVDAGAAAADGAARWIPGLDPEPSGGAKTRRRRGKGAAAAAAAAAADDAAASVDGAGSDDASSAAGGAAAAAAPLAFDDVNDPVVMVDPVWEDEGGGGYLVLVHDDDGGEGGGAVYVFATEVYGPNPEIVCCDDGTGNWIQVRVPACVLQSAQEQGMYRSVYAMRCDCRSKRAPLRQRLAADVEQWRGVAACHMGAARFRHAFARVRHVAVVAFQVSRPAAAC